MTGCIQIMIKAERAEPHLVPVMIADTVATLNIPKEMQSGYVKRLPSTVTVSTSNSPSLTRLVRKLNICGDIAWAFAGDGANIDYVSRTIIDRIDEWKSVKNPVVVIRDMARSYKIEPLIIYMSDGGPSYIKTNNCETLPFLGFCQTIGSGAENLLGLCREIDREMQNFPDSSTWDDKFLSAIDHFNAQRLCEEIAGDKVGTWGGYFESAYWNGKVWIRGPKHVNLFFVGEISDNGDVIPSILPRAVAYDPGGEVGRVLSIYDGNVMEFQLGEIGNGQTLELLDWPKWRPESATVSFIMKPKIGENTYAHMSVCADQINFEINGSTIRFGLPQETLDRFVSLFNERMQSLAPQTSLPALE